MSIKRLFLFGFILVLLVGIPITLYFLQQQQEIRSRAQKSTTISITPDSSQTNPLQHKVSDVIPLDIMINPGQNLVSFVKLEINYNSDKFATASANGFVANTAVFPTVSGPFYSQGKIDLTLSVGSDPTKAIQQIAKAGTLTLIALAATPADTPSQVTFGPSPNTEVLSIGSSDTFSENVLSTANPAYILITDNFSTPTPSGGVPTPTSTPIPIPTQNFPTSTPVPTGGGGTGTPPVCSNLAINPSTSGPAPFSITTTANGTSTTGVINKVTFNFGDGQTVDVTDSGGVGSNSVNAQAAHTYQNGGTYQVSAVLTDNAGNLSNSTSCKQTVTVTSTNTPTPASGGPQPTIIAGGNNNGSNTGSSSGNINPSPTLAPTGSSDVALGAGTLAAILILGGGLLFFIF